MGPEQPKNEDIADVKKTKGENLSPEMNEVLEAESKKALREAMKDAALEEGQIATEADIEKVLEQTPKENGQ